MLSAAVGVKFHDNEIGIGDVATPWYVSAFVDSKPVSLGLRHCAAFG